MSDVSVEFGGFGPTTPARPIVKAKSRGRTKQSIKQRSHSVDQEPGPSQRPARNTVGKSAKPKKEEMVVESLDEAETTSNGGGDAEEAIVVPENVVASSDEDEVRVKMENQLNRNGTKAKNGGVNGRTRTQQSTKPSSSTKRQQKGSTRAVMEVQGTEDENDLDVKPPRPKRPREGTAREKVTGGRARGQVVNVNYDHRMDVDDILEGQDGIRTLIDKIGRAGHVTEIGSTSRASSERDAELFKLKEKISRLENENKVLAGQMEELCRVRQTEAEALMQRSEEEYEAKIRVLQEMNRGLTDELGKRQPLAGIGKSTVLNFVTRDVMDAEKQQLDQQIVKLQGELDEVMKKLSLRDKEINERKQTEQELRVELQAEIERASNLAKQPPRQPHPTPRLGYVAEDPKHREAIKLYEDLTNIIVLNIRTGPSVLNGNKEEWHFNCCYTHTNESDYVNATTLSLGFTLRSYEKITNGELADWIQYSPTSLDKESEEFVKSLEFLGAEFEFERNQLALFLRTLYTSFEAIVKGESDDGATGFEEDGESKEATDNAL